MAEIRVLGPIEGYRDGSPVDIGGPTQRRLLASLVAQPGEVVSVTALLEDLWGEDPPPSGPASIQSYVSRLRRGLGPDVIETTAPGYRLSTTQVAIDSLEFLDIAARLPPEHDHRLDTIEKALDLWRGPAFEDFDHVDFASRRLTETRLDLEEERALLLAGSGRLAEGVAVLERLTATQPLRESAWLSLSKVLTRAGRQAEAVRALDRYRDNLADIGLEPGPAFSVAQDEAFQVSPPPPRRTPLPRVETSFVGRETELAELRNLLDESRLVTVTGPGGMGKSRLALEALREWAGLPLTVVRLASLRDDLEVAPTVLNAVGGETRGDPTEAVVARLIREPTLLFMDNAEHVIEATADLASQIVARTESAMVVTSREPLNVLGEMVLSLGSLAPAAAIDLYRDRAMQVSPEFTASSATLDMLCEELDYMPLAIEMAAARSKALAPDEILTRLSRRYGLLDKPLRGGSGRHRSLDALVDWSYSLLDPTEQMVFERLSVIAGGFDVDLAATVAGFGEVTTDQVPAALAGLVEKSLINRTAAGTYRILRVLKSFAAQRLSVRGDTAEARTIHARWFAGLATRIGDGLSAHDEMRWIEQANTAVEDLGAALAWSAENGDLDTTQQILEGLFDWFYHRQPPAILGWGEMVLPVASGHDVHSVAAAWAALAAMKAGEISKAHDLALAGTTVESAAGRFAWFMTGEVACYQDRLEDALDAYRRQLVRASNLDDRIGVVDAMAGETLALAFQGVFDRALEVARDLHEIAGDIGAPTYRAYADYALGEALIDSDPERSAALLEKAVDLAASVNNQFIQGIARTTLGSVLARLGRFDDSEANLRRAMEMWETMGLDAYRWTTVQYLAALRAGQGEMETAIKLLAAAEKAGRRPFGAGQRHWVDVMESLRGHPDYESWAAWGRELDLVTASKLATTAIQPRR